MPKGHNLNKVVGYNAAYAVPLKQRKDLNARARKLLSGGQAMPSDTQGYDPQFVRACDEFDLVRMFIGSAPLLAYMKALGCKEDLIITRDDNTSVFGVRHQRGTPVALIIAVDLLGDSNAGILDILTSSQGSRIREDVLVEFLEHLDIPPATTSSQRSIYASHNLVWDASSGWSVVEPEYMARVTFERTCNETEPPLHETVDVLVPHPDNQDLATVFELKQSEFYELASAAWKQFALLQIRHSHDDLCFSSWNISDDIPTKVKVVSKLLSKELANSPEEASHPTLVP
ncbi:hypothetical protein SAMN05428964_103424 [Thalassospira xiamenensis]|uniref:Uncharacterized protein n=2 Tax=Thalassospira xiamenensis TaxID=220697 RepID=A0A285TH22_9PROT|nr:hypothetical protein SAMN05428964_103424 [Thalassospira xiamenensis]